MNIAIILLILLAGSLVTYFSGNRFASKVAMLFAIAAAAFSISLLLEYQSTGATSYSIEWISKPNIAFSLKVDGLSLVMLLLNSLLLPIIMLTSISHTVKSERILYSLVLFMSFAMTGVFLSSNALVYYVFWEMSLIPIYFIVVLWGNGERAKRRRSAMTFFIYTFAGSLFMLAAIIYMYVKVGSLELHDIYNANLSHTEQIWIFLAFFLAYAIKIPVFPFHTWQASVYQKAPIMGTLLLGALMSKMGLYSVIRWQLPVTPYAAHELRSLVLILSIIGVLYGAIIALRQDNLKRFFAYASLSHVGFIAAGVYALTYDGLQGAVILILAHGFGIIGLFFSAEVIHRRLKTPLISKMGGIKSSAPKFTIAFFFMILASIAIPLTFNFVGEFTIMYGVYQVHLGYLLPLGASMFLGAFFMLRMYQYVMLGDKINRSFPDLTINETLVFVLSAVVLIFFGIYSKPIVDIISPSLQELMTYINR
ncbi:complex I subunit 4 family protein [Dysgonomonas macrotermitis]|uniref:NADH dehydrogenase subunit M n=1 Tax=Dysgonomonas macrotermitis TaxID=1346286 RepID=A0A1M5G3G2_9BACT|nr:NADH-quinone oxidoreductase subunit M [Dysgonomonas macrotermitis]SHF98194.1 NADH dehydrogenase subunit M [Dysgonomonas macrotermitis]